MFSITKTPTFCKDFSKVNLTDTELRRLDRAIDSLVHNGTLPHEPPYFNHKLKGNRKDLYDFHIGFDTVVLYTKDKKTKQIILREIGTHNDILSS